MKESGGRIAGMNAATSRAFRAREVCAR